MFQNERRDEARSMISDEAASMESDGGPLTQGEDAPAAAVSAKRLWRVMRAVYLVVVKKHQPKLAALGVHLHHLLSSKHQRGDHRRGLVAAAREHPALTYLSSSLSCRSTDLATAVVHPRPRRVSTSSAAASLSCRSMDPAAAVRQYQYRPREVEFSCKSTPLHRRRREQRRLRLQRSAADQEYYGASVAAVTSLFELMDVKEAAEATTGADYDDDGDPDAAVAWPALTAGPTPRQVRITDSPFLAREEDEEGKGMVDRRADEFIVWFHEQLRTQQQRATYYWVR